MKKSYEQQVADVRAKEAEKAQALGFESVEAYRTHLSIANRIATYKAKIERYSRAIAEMQAYIEKYGA